MVELLTDYTTQIYHALSTDARPTGEPGAQLREIDTGKRFIFDGTSWNELPDGGGIPYIQKFEYIQTENWMTDNPGNTSNFANTYLNQGNGLYWCLIEQAYSGKYGGVKCLVLRNHTNDVSTQGGGDWYRKSGNWSVNTTTTASWYIEAGADITVYFIPNDAF